MFSPKRTFRFNSPPSLLRCLAPLASVSARFFCPLRLAGFVTRRFAYPFTSLLRLPRGAYCDFPLRVGTSCLKSHKPLSAHRSAGGEIMYTLRDIVTLARIDEMRAEQIARAEERAERFRQLRKLYGPSFKSKRRCELW